MVASDTYEEAVQLNRGTAVLVSSWTLIGTSAVFVLARGAARKKLAKLESGDILLPVALVLAFIQTVCIQFAVDNGLGRTYGILGTDAVNNYHKVTYWAQILYIIDLGISKTVIILLIIPLKPSRPLLFGCYIIGAEIVLSTIAFCFASAFSCELPRPWEVDSGKCINISAFWRALCITTLVTDVLAICPPLIAMLQLQLSSESKILVCSLLLTRLCVPVFVVVQLVYVIRFDTSMDPTYDAVSMQIWTQVVLNASIITACIPPLGCILSDMTSAITHKQLIPEMIGWGRYSPQGMSRIPTTYAEKNENTVTPPDKIPLCSRGLSSHDSGRSFNEPINAPGTFSWFRLNPSSKSTIHSDIEHQIEGRTKQVHFADIPPMPMTPPSNRYPDTEIRSTTLDVLSDYTYGFHPVQNTQPATPTSDMTTNSDPASIPGHEATAELVALPTLAEHVAYMSGGSSSSSSSASSLLPTTVAEESTTVHMAVTEPAEATAVTMIAPTSISAPALVYPPRSAISRRRSSNASLSHKRQRSSASLNTRISEPTFLSASTLVTPPSSRRESREPLPYGHRISRSLGSMRSIESTAQYHQRQNLNQSQSQAPGPGPGPSSISSVGSSLIREHSSFWRRQRQTTHGRQAHRRSFSSLPTHSRRSVRSGSWSGWFERWNTDTIGEEESSVMSSGSFVNLDEEFDRCRNVYGGRG